MSNTPELLPCPFCDSQPVVKGDLNPSIKCEICDVEMRSNRFISAMWEIGLGREKQIAEASARWNRRLGADIGIPMSLSPWSGWDQSRLPWSEAKHKDAVCYAVFGDTWSVEDAHALISFIDRTWSRTAALQSAADTPAPQTQMMGLVVSGQEFANQVRSITHKLHGQAYSSTVSALNKFDADLRRVRASITSGG